MFSLKLSQGENQTFALIYLFFLNCTSDIKEKIGKYL